MNISRRMLNMIRALIIVSGFGVAFSLTYKWLFLISIPLLILTIYLYYTKCRCPYCNTWENMECLIYQRITLFIAEAAEI